MGHEAIGLVEDVGSDVRNIKAGDLVVMPFAFSDGTCAFCHEGLHTACVHGGFFDGYGTSAAQAEAVESHSPTARCFRSRSARTTR